MLFLCLLILHRNPTWDKEIGKSPISITIPTFPEKLGFLTRNWENPNFYYNFPKAGVSSFGFSGIIKNQNKMEIKIKM